MLHWNSLWTVRPPGTPANDEPTAWQWGFSLAPLIELQARQWEQAMDAGRAWLNFWMSAWPVPHLPPLSMPPRVTQEQPAESSTSDGFAGSDDAEPEARRSTLH